MTANADTTTPATGRRVLVVEDEALIAMEVEEELERAGYSVVGPAPSAKKALILVERESLDAAVLDYRLAEGTSREIAAVLAERNIPFVFMTGHGVDDLPRELRGCMCLAKPAGEGVLIATLEAIFAAPAP